MSLTQFLTAFRYFFFFLISLSFSSSPFSFSHFPEFQVHICPFSVALLQSSIRATVRTAAADIQNFSFAPDNHSEGSLSCFRLIPSSMIPRLLLLSAPDGGCLIGYPLCPAFVHSEARDSSLAMQN